MIYYVREYAPDNEWTEPEHSFVDFGDLPDPIVTAMLATQRVEDPEGDTIHEVLATMISINWRVKNCCASMHWTDYLALEWFFRPPEYKTEPNLDRFRSVPLPLLQELVARQRVRRPAESELQDAFEAVLNQMETNT